MSYALAFGCGAFAGALINEWSAFPASFLWAIVAGLVFGAVVFIAERP